MKMIHIENANGQIITVREEVAEKYLRKQNGEWKKVQNVSYSIPSGEVKTPGKKKGDGQVE